MPGGNQPLVLTLQMLQCLDALPESRYLRFQTVLHLPKVIQNSATVGLYGFRPRPHLSNAVDFLLCGQDGGINLFPIALVLLVLSLLADAESLCKGEPCTEDTSDSIF